MKKPNATAPESEHRAYFAWVTRQLETWDPADDRGSSTIYVPRFDGVRGLPNHLPTRSYDANDQD